MIATTGIPARRLQTAALALLLGLLWAASGQGQDRNPALATRAQTCLWSVGSGSPQVFLLGSIHFLRPESYPLPPALDAAYAASRMVVFETDIGRMQDPRVQARMLELGMLPAGQSVFAGLGGGTRRKLEQKLSAAGLPAAAVAGMKPWLIALTLTSLELVRLGFDPSLGVDMHFFQRAQQDGKRIGELETIEHQLQVLAGMGAREQEAFLVQTMDELDHIPGMADDLLRYWLAGEIEALQQLLFKSLDRYPAVRDRVLVQRNQAWIERIEGLIRGGQTTLVIVGAMHLIGPDSVVDLLKKKGYRVEQMQ